LFSPILTKIDTNATILVKICKGEVLRVIGVARYEALGHVPPSTSNCLIFLVTSESHKLLTFDSMRFPYRERTYRPIVLSLFIARIS